MISSNNLVKDQVFDFFLICIELVFFTFLQGCQQLLILGTDRSINFFFFGCRQGILQSHLCFCIKTKILFFEKRFEFGKIRIGHGRNSRSKIWIFIIIGSHKIENPVVFHQCFLNRAQFGFLHYDIGKNATAIINGASFSGAEGIVIFGRSSNCASVFVFVKVIERLNTSAGRRVIT